MFRDSQIPFFQKNVTKISVFRDFVTFSFLVDVIFCNFFVMSANDCHETSEKPIFRDRF